MSTTDDRVVEPEDEHTDVAEESPFESLPVIRRRRPSGEAGPAPGTLGMSGWVWLVLGGAALAAWIGMLVGGRVPSWLDRVDSAIGRALTNTRPPWLTTVARAVALLGSVGFIIVLRWATIGALAIFRRGRHLVTYIGVVLVVRLVVVSLIDAIGRPRPAIVPYLYGWEGYSHPSAVVAMLAVTLVGAAYTLVPGGRWRTVGLWIGGTLVGLLCLARVYLGVDHASDAALAGLAAWACGTVAFRIFCPEEVFPVTYRRGRAAHLEIDERREQAIREALEEQADMQLREIEPFGQEGSGGSTPLRVLVQRERDGREETLFAKLYSAAHLQADRWYKLGRTIMYGALEDEFAYNSVRQLVEHEDYMLRLFQEAGVSSVGPRGFVELDPEREYLIMMTMLERADEADEDAPVNESVIDDGIGMVRKMWDHGLAHRDIKPANVLIHSGKVSLIDVAFGQMRPSSWRQAVDLANMMLVLALSSDPELVYQRAEQQFTPEEIGEAFAAATGPAIPRQLRDKLKEDDRDLIGTFRALAPDREPIAIQRWTIRRVGLAVRTAAVAVGLLGLLAVNLANPYAP